MPAPTQYPAPAQAPTQAPGPAADPSAVDEEVAALLFFAPSRAELLRETATLAEELQEARRILDRTASEAIRASTSYHEATQAAHLGPLFRAGLDADHGHLISARADAARAQARVDHLQAGLDTLEGYRTHPALAHRYA